MRSYCRLQHPEGTQDQQEHPLLEPSPVATELSNLFADGRITAGQMEAMLLAYHRAA
jgi:hypothetical protein